MALPSLSSSSAEAIDNTPGGKLIFQVFAAQASWNATSSAIARLPD
jgi:hypothetical protein